MNPTKKLFSARFRLLPIYFVLLGCSVLTPRTGSAAEPLMFEGITEAYQDVQLGIAVPGRVGKIHATEGAKVAQGEVILELDQQQEKLEAERRKLIWQNKAEVEAAALQLKTLETHLAATKDLYQRTGSVNREDLENQELEFAVAKTELARLENAEKREEVEYQLAREQLEKRTLRAPFPGVVVELIAGIGENCDTDKPLVHFIDSRRGYFVANVELATSRKLKIGQTVKLNLQSGDETQPLSGEIVFISPVVDPASGLRKIKALYSNKDGLIVPGIGGQMLVTE